MKFYGKDQFSEQNSQQGYNNGYNQNPQQQPNSYNQPQAQFTQPTESKKTEQKEEKTPVTKGDVIIVVGILLWIAATIIASIVLVSTTGNYGWGLVSLGQFVFFSGIILYIGDKDKHGPSIFPSWILTGFITLASGITLVITKPKFIYNLWDILPYLGVLIFLGLAIIGLHDYTLGEKHRKKRCKIPVQAEIIDHLRGTSSYRQGVYPLFRYTYNGKVYEERDYLHAPREAVPPKGSYITLYINENKPEKFHCDWNGRHSSLNIQRVRYVGLIIFWVLAFCIIPFITK